MKLQTQKHAELNQNLQVTTCTERSLRIGICIYRMTEKIHVAINERVTLLNETKFLSTNSHITEEVGSTGKSEVLFKEPLFTAHCESRSVSKKVEEMASSFVLRIVN